MLLFIINIQANAYTMDSFVGDGNNGEKMASAKENVVGRCVFSSLTNS
jgi:hypothetical protein